MIKNTLFSDKIQSSPKNNKIIFYFLIIYYHDKTDTFKENARKNMFQGMEMVADAVKVTMGPKGRNVIVAKSY